MPAAATAGYTPLDGLGECKDLCYRSSNYFSSVPVAHHCRGFTLDLNSGVCRWRKGVSLGSGSSGGGPPGGDPRRSLRPKDITFQAKMRATHGRRLEDADAQDPLDEHTYVISGASYPSFWNAAPRGADGPSDRPRRAERRSKTSASRAPSVTPRLLTENFLCYELENATAAYAYGEDPYIGFDGYHCGAETPPTSAAVLTQLPDGTTSPYVALGGDVSLCKEVCLVNSLWNSTLFSDTAPGRSSCTGFQYDLVTSQCSFQSGWLEATETAPTATQSCYVLTLMEHEADLNGATNFTEFKDKKCVGQSLAQLDGWAGEGWNGTVVASGDVALRGRGQCEEQCYYSSSYFYPTVAGPDFCSAFEYDDEKSVCRFFKGHHTGTAMVNATMESGTTCVVLERKVSVYEIPFALCVGIV